MINNISLTGRLAHDPELHYTKLEIPVTTIVLAVPRRYIKKGEIRKTDFFHVVFWRHDAEFIADKLKKGCLVGIEGYLQTRELEKNGEKTVVTEVIGEKITFLERNVENNEDKPESVPEDIVAEEQEGSKRRDTQPYSEETGA